MVNISEPCCTFAVVVNSQLVLACVTTESFTFSLRRAIKTVLWHYHFQHIRDLTAESVDWHGVTLMCVNWHHAWQAFICRKHNSSLIGHLQQSADSSFHDITEKLHSVDPFKAVMTEKCDSGSCHNFTQDHYRTAKLAHYCRRYVSQLTSRDNELGCRHFDGRSDATFSRRRMCRERV